MLNARAVEPGVRRIRLVSVAFAVGCLLVALTCLASGTFAWRQGIMRRPVVLHLSRLILTAEITVDPRCAPLAEDCMAHHPSHRYRYFSMWLYLTTPPKVSWQIDYWHLIAIRLGPGDQ